jgi:putative transposase
MKQVIALKLAPTPEQHAALLRTLVTFNAACNAIAAVAFAEHTANKLALQKLVYYDVRERFGLAAQMTIRAIAKVAEAYKRDRQVRPTFRPHGAMTYDERILSFPRPDRASLLTLDGRAEMPFRFGAYQAARLDRVRGQADLLYRNGTFYLACTVDMPVPFSTEPAEYLGVDLGIVHLAATSDGEFVDQGAGPIHAHVNTVRARFVQLRRKLQKKGTRSAKRLLRKWRRRERRFIRDTNHCISKALVSTAQGTARGLALEDLTGIRERLASKKAPAQRTVGKRQRRVLSSWAFFQLRAFIAYKAALAGVRIVLVDPRNTSRQCSRCGHVDQASRTSQAHFLCTSCGYACHADVNAAVNIGRRAALVIPPDAAPLAG